MTCCVNYRVCTQRRSENHDFPFVGGYLRVGQAKVNEEVANQIGRDRIGTNWVGTEKRA
jgi:hypothetical protein